ncbi:glycosyltransferase [Mangrovimicrobium sediminis]|uniref:Glycosyltransferase n=1 Tax=Mangrovimicrobium sediminis TaxID=2562682 RepID=A0A4Z0LXA5_9GAMM|nr:glycosyltransferase family 2 protein [Haliea sp. SAOS-164]TGD71880.1 glycosyltransferase [Haliea sp. SAOS-164]
MSPAEKLITVVIPLYNKRETIRRAISSVLAQSEPRFELVVVDDGSTDDSAEIVAEFQDPRLRLVRQENAGPGAARNTGARLGECSYLAFLDADDEWEPGFLSTALSRLEEFPQAIAYVCGYDAGEFRLNRPNKILALGISGCLNIAADTDGKTLKKYVDAMHSSCTMVRRDDFFRVGGYYAKNSCRYGEDSYLWLSILLSGPVFWDPEELTRFHVEDSSLGFATTRRTQARPISIEGLDIGSLIEPEMLPALKRVVLEYTNMDLGILRRSGAFPQAVELRAIHGLNDPGSLLKDGYWRLRYLLRLC